MLKVRPSTKRKANAFIRAHHRHHKPPAGAKFYLAVESHGVVCGVAVVGRPVSRHLDDGLTAEVNRVATDGTRNACSKLYAASAHVWRAMGGESILTYTLPAEGGASLRAAGWDCEGPAGGGLWDRVARERRDDAPTCVKWRWRKRLG